MPKFLGLRQASVDPVKAEIVLATPKLKLQPSAPQKITLKPTKKPETVAPAPVAEEMAPAVVEPSRMRVLIVDPNETFAYLLRSQLRGMFRCDITISSEITTAETIQSTYHLLVIESGVALPEGLKRDHVLTVGEDILRPLRDKQIKSVLNEFRMKHKIE